MGSLILPEEGLVYVDANIAIYSVDRHPVYGAICDPIWQAAQNGALIVASSELTILECLIGPLRNGDSAQARRRERVWDRPNTRLLPITRDVLLEAARLRANIPALKSPDAIHAATALLSQCSLFITNDMGFRRVPNLPLVILDDVIAAP